MQPGVKWLAALSALSLIRAQSKARLFGAKNLRDTTPISHITPYQNAFPTRIHLLRPKKEHRKPVKRVNPCCNKQELNSVGPITMRCVICCACHSQINKCLSSTKWSLVFWKWMLLCRPSHSYICTHTTNNGIKNFIVPLLPSQKHSIQVQYPLQRQHPRKQHTNVDSENNSKKQQIVSLKDIFIRSETCNTIKMSLMDRRDSVAKKELKGETYDWNGTEEET